MLSECINFPWSINSPPSIPLRVCITQGDSKQSQANRPKSICQKVIGEEPDDLISSRENLHIDLQKRRHAINITNNPGYRVSERSISSENEIWTLWSSSEKLKAPAILTSDEKCSKRETDNFVKFAAAAQKKKMLMENTFFFLPQPQSEILLNEIVQVQGVNNAKMETISRIKNVTELSRWDLIQCKHEIAVSCDVDAELSQPETISAWKSSRCHPHVAAGDNFTLFIHRSHFSLFLSSLLCLSPMVRHWLHSRLCIIPTRHSIGRAATRSYRSSIESRQVTWQQTMRILRMACHMCQNIDDVAAQRAA